jgi:tetratricopeptide (TPR) repeat protein
LSVAEDWYHKALEVKLRLGDEDAATTTYHNLGTVAQARQDLAGAEKWYHKALEVKLRLGDEQGAAPTYVNLGVVAEDRRDLAGAEEWYRKALELFLRLGDEHNAAKTYHNLGSLAAQKGQAGCIGHFLRALKLFAGCKDYHFLAGVVASLREAYHDGIITRDAVEQSWQAEIGVPLPANVAESIFGPGEQGGSSPAPDAPPPNAT